jgi:cytochrome oxidase Cu insertion factor (SCO1/SenC/PrrC family)
MPSRRGSTQLGLAAALVLAAGCHRAQPLPAGDLAATLTVSAVDGHPFDPAVLRGKPALVVFATPTCPHCLVTLPAADAAARAASATPVAVFVVGKAENAADVVARTHFSGPVLVDDGTLRAHYDIHSVPVTLVLGPDGHARDLFVGEQTEATLRAALD